MELYNIYYLEIKNITKFYYNSKKDLFTNFGYEYDDVFQEVSIFICEKLKYYDYNKSNIKTYLTRLIRSKISELIEFNYKEKRKANLKDYSEIEDYDNFYNDEKIEFIELKEIITKELTDKEKNILLLLMEGYSLEDVGRMYNMTRQGINYYKVKIKNKLSMYI